MKNNKFSYILMVLFAINATSYPVFNWSNLTSRSWWYSSWIAFKNYFGPNKLIKNSSFISKIPTIPHASKLISNAVGYQGLSQLLLPYTENKFIVRSSANKDLNKLNIKNDVNNNNQDDDEYGLRVKTYYGLKNSTHVNCYLNAVLQAIINVPPIPHHIMHHSEKDRISTEFLKIVVRFYFSNNDNKTPNIGKALPTIDLVTPVVTTVMTEPDNVTTVQNDSSECLVNFLNYFIAQDKNLKDLVAIKTSNISYCLNCDYWYKEANDDKEKWDVVLDLAIDGKTLYSCLDKHCSDERLKDSKCDCCGQQKRYRSIRFEQLPEVLIIKLNRYNSNYTKKFDKALFPLCLDLDAYIENNNQNNIDCIYELKSLCLHHGSTLKGGHYTAVVNNDNNIYHCDDSTVTYLGKVDSYKQLMQKVPGEIYYSIWQRKKNVDATNLNPNLYITPRPKSKNLGLWN